MSNGIDAYHKWLSIPPQDQPPNHYRLLGLGLFESDADVVAAAADRQMAHVQTYKTGPHSELSQKLLNEISAAKLCLLRPQKKAAYDRAIAQAIGGITKRVTAERLNAKWLTAGPCSTRPSDGERRQRRHAVSALRRRTGRSASARSSAAGGRCPPRALLGTLTVLIGAGVVAVLLLIGIIVVLSHRNNRPPVSPAEKSTVTNSEAAPSASTSNIGGSTEKGSTSHADNTAADNRDSAQSTVAHVAAAKPYASFEHSGCDLRSNRNNSQTAKNNGQRFHRQFVRPAGERRTPCQPS